MIVPALKNDQRVSDYYKIRKKLCQNIIKLTCFDENGVFIQGPIPNPKELEERFRYEILKMLKKEGKINVRIDNFLLYWDDF